MSYNPYDNVLATVENAANILGYKPAEYEAVKYPERELSVSVPVRMDDGSVKVYVEKPDAKDGFYYATCFLPEYRWEDVSGFSEAEIHKYQEIISSTAHLIMRFAAEGGLENAAGF